MSLFSVYLLCWFYTSESATFTSKIDLSNITNPLISKYIYGVDIYQKYGLDAEYTGNYTIGRLGGNGQSRYNYAINAANAGNDYYWINSKQEFTLKQRYDIEQQCGMVFWTQIPTLGWVAKSDTKSWSFSQEKYGKQQKDECTNQPSGCTWCSSDAGNGVWINGSNVIGNDPNDCSIKTKPSDGAAFVQSVINEYGIANTVVFSIDNEPTLWSSTHRDVHPIGSTYEEIVNDTIQYATQIKKTCNNNENKSPKSPNSDNGTCLVAGFSPWGWCGYFEDGYDHEHGYCEGGGPDWVKHDNTSLIEYYLKELKKYENNNNGKRLLDILDVHYYPAASGVKFGCNESDAQMVTNRLQSPRSLYDATYIDGSWIKGAVNLIPRMKGYINKHYPNTLFSISEYNFGGDTCITSTIAHSEALAIFATFGVSVATRWSKPVSGSLVTNAWNIFTNYDGIGSNIYDCNPFAVNVKDSDLEMITSYAFVSEDKTKMFVVAFNKDGSNENEIQVSFVNNKDNLVIKGDINVFGVDQNGIGKVGIIQSNNGNSFDLTIPAWTIRLAVVAL